MKAYQSGFLELAVASGALRFGQFTLKSGRSSPYFFDSGRFDRGARLAELAGYYAEAIRDAAIPFDALFGSAYKGIPLAAAVAVVLARDHDLDVPYAFDRKEPKDHGEGGRVVGSLSGRVLIVDDVISAGTSIGAAIELIRAAGATPAAAVIALDRQERDDDGVSAVESMARHHGVPVISIVRLDDLVRFLEQRPGLDDALAALRDYRSRYGA